MRHTLSNTHPRWARLLGLCLIASCLLGLPALLAAEDRVRIGDSEVKTALVTRVEPPYPPMAKQMKIAGKVEVDALVDVEGNVEKVEAVTGNAILFGACSTAVKKWKFNPFLNAGKPTPATVRLAFNFKLAN